MQTSQHPYGFYKVGMAEEKKLLQTRGNINDLLGNSFIIPTQEQTWCCCRNGEQIPEQSYQGKSKG